MNRVFLISFFLLLTGGICAQQATTGVLTLKEAEAALLDVKGSKEVLHSGIETSPVSITT